MVPDQDREVPGRFLGRTRRAKLPGGRTRQINVRVSTEEWLGLQARAVESGMSVPRLLVDAALRDARPAPTVSPAEASELFAIRRLLAGVANNVNQVAKVTNATGETPAQTEDVFRAVARLVARLDALMDKVRVAR